MAAESALEAKCRKAVEVTGGRMPKWVSPGNVGVPDRLLLIPKAEVVFVEFKAPGGRLRPDQLRWTDWLRRKGFPVWVIDNYHDFTEKLDALILAADS